ncbi:MAG: hypothetical protein ACOYT4_01035 [Nanoarchaeota archaeon]
MTQKTKPSRLKAGLAGIVCASSLFFGSIFFSGCAEFASGVRDGMNQALGSDGMALAGLAASLGSCNPNNSPLEQAQLAAASNYAYTMSNQQTLRDTHDKLANYSNEQNRKSYEIYTALQDRTRTNVFSTEETICLSVRAEAPGKEFLIVLSNPRGKREYLTHKFGSDDWEKDTYTLPNEMTNISGKYNADFYIEDHGKVGSHQFEVY